ncbi:GNAT family N-acetyltransferase [soil metagenome]
MELRLLDSLAAIPASDWDALHDGGNPFVSHGFLSGLELHGCLQARLGWQPRHACLFEGEQLVAAAPAYQKNNSHGEFVFDHAWAHAYERHGMDYYPKWLCAVPYSPVPGPRLLGRDAALRATLASAMSSALDALPMSSLHVNFIDPEQLEAFGPEWLARADVQFHWRNPGDWTDFDGFLGALNSRKRKTIRAERTQVARAGVTLRRMHGDEASAADIAIMHGLYCVTQHDKGNRPALTLEFFQHLARTMPRALLIVLAERNGEPIAGAMFLRGAQTLYGRYWGSTEAVPGLHFEACYYQGIDYCLSEGLTYFEPGAQGEHKIARGFLPVLTHSRHRVRDPEFAAALAPWCAQERQSAQRYRDAVLEHSPFRRDDAGPPAGP